MSFRADLHVVEIDRRRIALRDRSLQRDGIAQRFGDVAREQLGEQFRTFVRISGGERHERVQSHPTRGFHQRTQADARKRVADPERHGCERLQRALFSRIDVEEDEVGFVSVFTREVHACSTIEARLATYASVGSSLQTTYVTFFPPSADDAVTRATQSGTPFGRCFSKNEKPSMPSG